MSNVDAIILVSFGGPEGPDDVVPFLENVTAGRGIPHHRLVEVGAHYAHFGGVSPINEQCRRIRSMLEKALSASGRELPVYWGNRNWHPYLSDTVGQMADDGVRHALAVVTSAYSSYSGCRQYLEDIQQARSSVGAGAPVIDKIRAYHDHPEFIADFTAATVAAQAQLGTDGAAAPIIFTAHSLPTASAASSDYEAQIRDTARLVVAGLPAPVDWTIAWQSRSGPPTVPWLEPDINDELRRLADADAGAAVIVPIGFVSDHMEVVWDLDVEARTTARDAGIRLARAATPGTKPGAGLISMFVDLIEERLTSRAARASLGVSGDRPDTCPGDCCPAPTRSR